MDPRERYNDPQEALLAAQDGRQAQIWTNMPGMITAVNLARMTCEVQPTIKAIQRSPTGVISYVNIPVLPDVLIVFPRGGGYSLTFPVAIGDECELWIQSRCVDAWFQSGGVQQPMDWRMHDLSDAFCMVGPTSLPHVVANISTTTVQLRSDNGNEIVELDKTGGIVYIKATTKIVLDAPLVQCTGEITATGDVTTNVGPGFVTLLNHVHDQAPDSHGDAEAATNPPTPGA